MKSKLVKYPFDEKKYRWDTQKMGKEFEYSWDVSRPNNYEEITPFIKAVPFVKEEDTTYVSMARNATDYINDLKASASTITSSLST